MVIPVRRAAGAPSHRGAARRFALATTFGLVATATLTLAVSPTARADAARYELDPEHMSIAFLVDHIGYAKVIGLFRKAGGSYRFDEPNATLTDLKIEIETDSVDTNHRKRDEHLRGGDFLDVRKHPKMIFTAAGAERQGDRDFIINGELELLGRRQPVTLTARWNKSSVYEIGTFNKPYVMGVSARGSFRRSAFGMMYGVDNGWVGDEVQMLIEFEARRQ